MKNKKKDYLDGDHSFRNWFRIMWKNKYIQIFAGAIIGIIFQLIYWGDISEMIKDNFADSIFGGTMVLIAMLIPAGIASLVAYKGFWQFWNDLKNGRSR